MTIGKFGHDYTTGPNPDFISLMKCHKEVCEALKLNEADVSVSMGMSDDFEEAVSSNDSLALTSFVHRFFFGSQIKMGSTIVRVGSSIFGHRVPKQGK